MVRREEGVSVTDNMAGKSQVLVVVVVVVVVKIRASENVGSMGKSSHGESPCPKESRYGYCLRMCR